MSLNTFDFYSVYASASTKTALKKVGVDPTKIERRADGFRTYGAQSFRRWSYRATVKFFELHQQVEAYAFAEELNAKNPGVLFGVNYHTVD
jgi:hypothetical protein